TKTQAKRILAGQVHDALVVDQEPWYLRGFDGSLWIAHYRFHQWIHAIVRPVEGSAHEVTGLCIGGYERREDALEAMRAHWYANFVQPLVNGLVALCTDRRVFTCPACGAASVSGAPYVCQSPACGHLVAASESPSV